MFLEEQEISPFTPSILIAPGLNEENLNIRTHKTNVQL